MAHSQGVSISPPRVKLQNRLPLSNGLPKGSPFALANPVTFTNAGTPKVGLPDASRSWLIRSNIPVSISLVTTPGKLKH